MKLYDILGLSSLHIFLVVGDFLVIWGAWLDFHHARCGYIQERVQSKEASTRGWWCQHPVATDVHFHASLRPVWFYLNVLSLLIWFWANDFVFSHFLLQGCQMTLRWMIACLGAGGIHMESLQMMCFAWSKLPWHVEACHKALYWCSQQQSWSKRKSSSGMPTVLPAPCLHMRLKMQDVKSFAWLSMLWTKIFHTCTGLLLGMRSLSKIHGLLQGLMMCHSCRSCDMLLLVDWTLIKVFNLGPNNHLPSHTSCRWCSTEICFRFGKVGENGSRICWHCKLFRF